ncbi:urease accessory protein UreE [uncultured Campylobacter sp.]|uniref:urease accessory protein UreE n=1 Tax=uncultured Campylobacter sp. TaxID=218934 RepID=UPI00261C5715|nr:urease accessory protein UreE [uncultured Campylobacter sp.]
MIVKEILGNIANFDTKTKEIVKVKIGADDRLKRVVRLTSDNGVDIGINLNDEVVLKDGDILGEDDKFLYVLECLAQDVLVIKPKEMLQMGFAAHSIGNRHAPAVFKQGAMIVEYDYLIAKWLDENKIPYSRQNLVLATPLKHATHRH